MMVSGAYTTEKEKNLPLQVIAIGVDHLQESVVRPNGLQFYQLVCCTHGTGEATINGRHAVIRKGQGMFMVPGKPQDYRALAPGWKVDFIVFSGPLCTPVLHSLGLDESDIISFSRADVFRKHIRRIARLSGSTQEEKGLLYSQECYAMLLDVAFHINRMETDRKEEVNDTVGRAIDFMEQNYDKDLSLGEIAAYVHLSKEHLCRIFKENTSETVIGYLTTIRIYQARRMLLQHPEKAAGTIAMECGFRSASYFSKVFSDKVGMSPNAYGMHSIRQVSG